jgi:hypothetical protein
MKKFFLNTLYAGVIVCITVLAGCMNLLEPQKEAAVPQGRGSVVVTIGETAAGGFARTIAPAESEFDKITLTFSGEEDVASVDVTGGSSASASLWVGSWTITATGYIETEPDVYVPAAEGKADVEVISGDTVTVNILLGPTTGGGKGTFSYSLLVPYTISSGQLIITTAEGESVETISLSYSYSGITGSRDLDPGQYLMRIRLQRGDGAAAMYAGLTEALHIYSGLTSALPRKEFTADDFKTAVSELDLTSLITAPVFWQAPIAAFAGTDQYTGTVAWRESDGATPVADVFKAGAVYKAIVTLTAKTDYTFTGVVENSFTYSGATTVTNNADSGVVTITFPQTETQVITGVTVSPPSPSVAQGRTQVFSAVVTGSVTPPQAVKWTITGNSDAGTTIAADGTLTVALNESASTLTVTAASVADPSQDDTATVTVTAASVIDIPSETELAKIGVDPGYPLGGRYRLTANLTLSDWVPIGDDTAPFFGVIDGNGKTITLQSFDAAMVSTKTHLGIFGYVKGGSAASKAAIKDLVLISQINHTSAHTGGQAIGVLAGFAESMEIANITLSGSFAFSTEKNTYFGGVVGYAQKGTTVKDSNTSMTITVDGGSAGGLIGGMYYNYTGGVVGAFKDGVDIVNCHNTGNVTADCATAQSQVFCGGIAGGSYYAFTTEYQGKIEDCSSTGNITAKCKGFWSWAGGIAGCIVGDGDGTLENTTRIMRCRASGTVSVADSGAGYPYVGGVVGYNYYGALTAQSYFNGDVIANKVNDYVGGIAGYNSQSTGHNSRIEDCWSSGTVTGFRNAGGIVGQNQINTYIRRCYSTATVIATDTGATGVGGIAGMNASAMANAITACVALNPSIQAGTTANIHRIVGGGASTQNINNLAWSGMMVTTAGTYTPGIGANGKDGADIAVQPSQADYVALGWDFGSVWAMDAYGYPKLQWQTVVLPRPPLAGPVPVVSVENYNHYDTSDYTTNAGGKLTVSWQPVPGATSYDIYYAPRTTDAPDIPASAAAAGETGTSKEFTGATIGENTMNYYVWIKATNPAGTSAPGAPASTLDFLQGQWEPSNYAGDYYLITNADIVYDYFGYGLMGYIRAVLPADADTFNGHSGSAGVIIVEYDRDYTDAAGWGHAADKYFNACYYYGVQGAGGSGSSMYMGFASNLDDYTAGCETETFAEAKAKFTFSDIENYYSLGVEIDYLWTE